MERVYIGAYITMTAQIMIILESTMAYVFGKHPMQNQTNLAIVTNSKWWKRCPVTIS